MSLASDAHPISHETPQPFSQEEERADDFSMDNNEIGLLDVVIMDAFASGEVCPR
jgi:hypothetical protein